MKNNDFMAAKWRHLCQTNDILSIKTSIHGFVDLVNRGNKNLYYTYHIDVMKVDHKSIRWGLK